MIISANKMQTLKASPNSANEVILSEFLCQSNKIEGSTFTFEQVELFYATNKVTGDHYFENIIETKNSFKMFDRMVDTLGVELTPELLIEFETILHRGTTMAVNGERGHFKYIPNRIRNSSVQVALLSDIPTAIPALLAEWESVENLVDVVLGHVLGGLRLTGELGGAGVLRGAGNGLRAAGGRGDGAVSIDDGDSGDHLQRGQYAGLLHGAQGENRPGFGQAQCTKECSRSYRSHAGTVLEEREQPDFGSDVTLIVEDVAKTDLPISLTC